MVLRPPRSSRTDTLFPYTTLFRSKTVRRRKDGSLIDISLSVSPVRDANGTVIGASTIARDITERKQAEERQRLLLREMDHRMKNLFALAGSLVGMSVRDAASPQELASIVQERLSALARAHALTMPKDSAAGSNDSVRDRKSTRL